MPNLPEPPASKILVYRMPIPIRWGDMDAMGHVNNAVYFRYMETIRLAWFDALGVLPSVEAPGPVIINATCTFVRQFTFPGTIDARHYVGDFGRSSVETWIELSRSEVSFRAIDAREAAAYWRTGEPADKAGGYAIQGLGALFISALKGSYSGVMGLPLHETRALLRAVGYPLG